METQPDDLLNSNITELFIVNYITLKQLTNQFDVVCTLHHPTLTYKPYVWLSHTTATRMVSTYTKRDVQLIKVAPDDGLI